MKKICLLIALLCMICAAGCVGDILDITDDPASGSGGDGQPDGSISEVDFNGEVTVTYSSDGASVSGTSDQFSVASDGGSVVITYAGSDNILYILKGESANGSFKLYSEARQAVRLEGLNLTNPAGAAINIQSGRLTYVEVTGSNSLSDSGSAQYPTDGEDCKGVLFSEGSLLFSGSGSLTVNCQNSAGKSGIVSDDHIAFSDSPAITVTAGSAAGHGVKANDYVQISGGNLDITARAAMKKGITSDDYVLVEGGSTTINISGGVAYDSEDGEYTGSAGIKADNFFGMTGGTVAITNTGTGGKGIRAGVYGYDSKNHTLSDSYVRGGSLSITTTGSESNDVSCKGIKIGYKESATKAGWGGNSGNYVYAGNMTVSGGSIFVKTSKSEAFEVKGKLTFNGGETYAYSAGDDAINSQGELNINDGFVYCYSSANDAIDTNGDLKLNGGYLYAISTAGGAEVAVDANTEGGYKLYINSGATLVAYGGLERGYSASQSVYTFGATANAWNGLYDGSKIVAAFKAPSNISSFVVSAPSLSAGYKGVTVAPGSELCSGVWATDGIGGGTSTSLSEYTGGGGSGPGGGPGGGGHWH
jgi:hypothetical protein